MLEELLEKEYARLGDERAPGKLTRRALFRGTSAATWCASMLWALMHDAARAHRVRPLPLEAFAPVDESAKEWVDRCIRLVRDWRIVAERGSRGRAGKRTASA